MISFTIFKLLIYAGLVIFIGYYFVYKIILKLRERKRIRTQGTSSEATVVDYKAKRDADGATRYYPILQYSTPDGSVIKVQSKKERFQKYEVGKKLTVYYMPEEPEQFFIAGLFPYIKLTSIVLGLIASLLLLFEIFKTLRRL